MYTYVFDDKENEIALNNIKAIIFDVITKEKAKQAVFRGQVANNADQKLQQQLLAILEEQETSLNNFIFLGNQLGELLKKVDSCSRNFGLSYDNNSLLTQGVEVNEAVKQPVSNSLVADSNFVDKNSPIVNESVDQNKENTMDNAIASSVEIISDDDIFEGPSNAESQSNLIVPSVNSENDNSISETIPDVKAENSPLEGVSAESAPKEGNSTEKDSVENTDGEEKHSSVQLVIPGVKKSDDDSSKKDVVNESSNSLPASGENDSNLLIPVDDEEEKFSDNDLIIDTSGSASTEEEADPMLDALLADNTKVEEEAKPKLTFKKRNNDLARAILTSGKQTASLRKSRDTQEALLSSRGFLVVNTNSNLEQQLVDNGLLPADNEAQMETMLNQANELYAAGKVEEAQAMYDKISELNKQLQGGAKVA